MLNEAKSLSNNNSWAKEGQRKAPKMNQSNQKGEPVRKPYENHSEKYRVQQNAKKNNKTTKKSSNTSNRRRSS